MRKKYPAAVVTRVPAKYTADCREIEPIRLRNSAVSRDCAGCGSRSVGEATSAIALIVSSRSVKPRLSNLMVLLPALQKSELFLVSDGEARHKSGALNTFD